MANRTSIVDSGITSVFLDLPTALESAPGLTLIGVESDEGEPFSNEFQAGFPIVDDTDFAYEIEPFAPVDGTIEHSGTITLGLGETEVTLGNFSIGFDAERVSETASGFFIADTTEDALDLEVLFDVGAPENVASEIESLTISEADLLISPELAEALGSSDLAGADIGDTRIDASVNLISIGETTALIPEAAAADEFSELIDGESGDTNYPYGEFKPLATVGEVDPNTGMALTGYPDGHAAWLLDEDTVRVAYQSESYATMSDETYPWIMDSGVAFTGSHIHTIDYDRAAFADFLNNDSAASEMFEDSGHLFNTVYNVFGEVVDPKNTDKSDLSAKWGNQTLPDGTIVEFMEDMQLSEGDFFFHSFCGAFYEPANKYGEGIGFEDDVYLMGEEWNIGPGMFGDEVVQPDLFGDGPLTGGDVANETMGLASMVVDVENETAYTVPALGQTGYEKLLPINSGHEDYVAIVAAGYNHDTAGALAPLKVYIGKKGVDAQGNELDEDASDRDSFLARNGLLYGQLYGIAADDATYSALGIADPDADTKMMDEYITSADAPDNFDVRYYPTSYQWEGFDSPEAVKDTEMFLWTQDGDDGDANEQPEGYTFFNGDTKTEHPAVDPDITKHRYVQHLTEEGGMLGIDFIDIVDELANNDADGNGLPDYLSAEATRIVPAVDGALTLETGGKGEGHVGPENPDGTLTAATHLDEGVAKMVSPDGLQWIKTADGDVLITDEDSGNAYGERKYALPIDSETMELAEPGIGYFLALAGGEKNLRAEAEVSALGNAFSSATSSEFSGSWNVTGLVAQKEDGSFYTIEELAGTGQQDIISDIPLSEQTLIGVVQHRGESGGEVEENKADQGGQIFMFNMENLPVGQNANVVNLLGKEDLRIEVTAEVNAGFTNIGGFYKAIDSEGTVLNADGEEVAVGEEGYEAAAKANSVVELGDGETTALNLEADSVYVPYLLANGIRFFTPYAEANPDGIDHVQSTEENSFGFEDLLGGGDGDFDDYVISFDMA